MDLHTEYIDATSDIEDDDDDEATEDEDISIKMLDDPEADPEALLQQVLTRAKRQTVYMQAHRWDNAAAFCVADITDIQHKSALYIIVQAFDETLLQLCTGSLEMTNSNLGESTSTIGQDRLKQLRDFNDRRNEHSIVFQPSSSESPLSSVYPLNRSFPLTEAVRYSQRSQLECDNLEYHLQA